MTEHRAAAAFYEPGDVVSWQLSSGYYEQGLVLSGDEDLHKRGLVRVRIGMKTQNVRAARLSYLYSLPRKEAL